MTEERLRNSPIELRHLYAFAALSRHLHFSRAAQALGITQPLLSMRIRALEELLGERLFDRRPKVAPTAAGRTFVSFAESAITALEEGAAAAMKAAGGYTGRLDLPFPTWMSSSTVPHAIGDFRRLYPNVDVSLHVLRSAQQLEAVSRGELHLGFLRDAQLDARFHQELLFREEWVAAVPADHPRAAGRAFVLKDLQGETLIIPDGQSLGLGEKLRTMVDDAGGAPSGVQEVGTWLAALSLVGAGAGIAIVPHGQQEQLRRGVAYFLLGGETTVSVFWLAGRVDPLLSAFLALLRTYRDQTV